ncbi:CELR1 protein, partial [Polypterus senegalus]
ADGIHEVTAWCTLRVTIITDDMLTNSITVRLENMSQEKFLSPLLSLFVEGVAAVLSTTKDGIFIFNIQNDTDVHTNILNVTFSALLPGGLRNEFFPSEDLQEQIYLNRTLLTMISTQRVLPFDDNICLREPCENYMKCVSVLKFDSSAPFISSNTVLFRPIHPINGLRCRCPPGFTGDYCETEIDLCYSNPCKNNGRCKSREGGYTCECLEDFTGDDCEVNARVGRCTPGVCKNGGTCVNLLVGGFKCVCPSDEFERPYCEVTTRSFPPQSFITFKGLRQRFHFTISLMFATRERNALLLYNGRFNEKHDFIALEIIEEQIQLTFSAGEATTTVAPYMPGGVSDGQWHSVQVHYYNKPNIGRLGIPHGPSGEKVAVVTVDDCDTAIAVRFGNMIGNYSCAAQGTQTGSKKSLDLTGPLLLGGVPNLPEDFPVRNREFVGCMRNLTIDSKPIDMASHIANNGTIAVMPFTMHFEGQSMIFWNEPDITISVPWYIGLMFRTRQSNGMLIQANAGASSKIVLMITNSYLQFEVYRGVTQIANLKLSQIKVNDGDWHHLLIELKSIKDGKDIKYLAVLSLDYGMYQKNVEIGNDLPGLKLQNLYVGGLFKDDKSVHQGFVGCMQGTLAKTVWMHVHLIHVNTSQLVSVSQILLMDTPVNVVRITTGNTVKTRTAVRHCNEEKGWLRPELFNCTTITFSELKTMQNEKMFRNETKMDGDKSLNIAKILRNATKHTDRFYGNDVKTAYQLLMQILQYESKQQGFDLAATKDVDFNENLIMAGSAILDPTNKEHWDQIQRTEGGTAHLLKHFEQYANNVAQNMRKTYLKPFTIVTPNMIIAVDFLDSSNPVSAKIPKFEEIRQEYPKDLKSTVYFPDAVFRLPENKVNPKEMPAKTNSPDTDDPSAKRKKRHQDTASAHIVAMVIIYRSLGQLLPERYDPDRRSLRLPTRPVINTPIVSTTVHSEGDPLPSQLDQPITLDYTLLETEERTKPVCVFWNHSIAIGGTGGWSSKGCELVSRNTTHVTCHCNHMTSFAVLMDISKREHGEVLPLKIVTYTTVSISLVALLVTFILLIIIRTLRSNLHSIHKNLVAALFFSELVFLIGINQTDNQFVCTVIAILLHYFYMCTFAWMFVEGLHIYRMLTEVRNINHGHMRFYYAIGWGIPAIITGLAVGLDPQGYGNPDFCWLSVHDTLIWSFAGPISLVVLTNIVIFVLAAKASCGRKQRSREKTGVISGLRTAFLLLLLISATWLLGLMAVNSDVMTFHYLFAIFSCLQRSLNCNNTYTDEPNMYRTAIGESTASLDSTVRSAKSHSTYLAYMLRDDSAQKPSVSSSTARVGHTEGDSSIFHRNATKANVHESDSDSELSVDEHSSSYASSHSSESEDDAINMKSKWNPSTPKNNERQPLHSTPKDPVSNHVKANWPVECASDSEEHGDTDPLKVETKVNVELHPENKLNHTEDPAQEKDVLKFGIEVERMPSRLLMSGVERCIAESNMTFLHSFDDLDLIAGYGSIGLEILDVIPSPDVILVCCGGGGLLSGVAAAIKLSNCSNTRVYGVEPEGACTMHKSFIEKRPVSLNAKSIAVGLAPPFAGTMTFAICQRYVEDILLVTDEEIMRAVSILYNAGLVVEPSGAAAFAALTENKVPDISGKTIVVILSGGNISKQELSTFPDYTAI